MLAAYWDDLQTVRHDHVRYGTVGTAPNRTFIVDYDGVDVDPGVEGGGADDLRFQVQIHERSNLINVRYHDTGSQRASARARRSASRARAARGATAQPLGCNGKSPRRQPPDEGWSVDVGRAGLIDARRRSSQHSPDDISGFTTLTGNDATATVALPFSVTLEGTSYNDARDLDQRLARVRRQHRRASQRLRRTTACRSANHTNPFLAAYWDDLKTFGTHIRYGTVGTSPNRVFIVDYEIDLVGARAATTSSRAGPDPRALEPDQRPLPRQQNANANGQAATIGFQGAGGARGRRVSAHLQRQGARRQPARRGLVGASEDARRHVAARRSWRTAPTTSAASRRSPATTAPRRRDHAVHACAIDGVNYTTVAISTNGWLEFGGNTPGTATRATLPADRVAHQSVPRRVLGRHACPSSTQIRYGTVGTSPNRMFIVDFDVDISRAPTRAPTTSTSRSRSTRRSNAISVKYRDSRARGRTARPRRSASRAPAAPARPRIRSSATARSSTTTGRTAGWSVAPLPICGNGAHGDATSRATRAAPTARPRRAAPRSAPSGRSARPAARRLASATSPRPARARAARVRPTPSSSSTTVCRSVRRRAATSPRTARAPAPPARATTMQPTASTADAAAGVCDVAENCDGVERPRVRPTPSSRARPSAARRPASATSRRTARASGAACPADAFEPSSTVCRAAAGVCDVAESCTGSGADCPARRLRRSRHAVPRRAPASATSPRAARARSAACPADRVRSDGTHVPRRGGRLRRQPRAATASATAARPTRAVERQRCRPRAGVCDVAEACNGVERACPADAFASSGTPCRPTRRRLRRRGELHGLERRPVRPTASSRPRSSAAAPPASATSPRTARARAPPVRPTPSRRRASNAAPAPARATSRRAARAPARPARPMR